MKGDGGTVQDRDKIMLQIEKAEGRKAGWKIYKNNILVQEELEDEYDEKDEDDEEGEEDDEEENDEE